MINVTRPNSPDVTVRNAKEKLYVKGDETTDGSLRIDPSVVNPGAVAFQLRTLGVWARTALDIAASTLHIGYDLSLATAGEWLKTTTLSHPHKSLIPHVHYNDADGTELAHSPLLSLKYTHHLYAQNFGGEVSGTQLEDSLVVDYGALNTILYLKGGFIAATEPVTVTLRRASPSGDIFWQSPFPPELFTSGKAGLISSITKITVAGTVVSVSDSGSGKAVFNTSAPHGLAVGQTIVNSGFSDPTYNTGRFVTGVVGPSSYEVGTVAFVGTDTGFFADIHCRAHAPSNGLANMETLRIYDTARYNGTYVIYNALPNTFDFNHEFISDEAGGWNSSPDIAIDLLGDVSTQAGDIWYASLTSAAPISLTTDLGGKWWFGVDLQLAETIQVVLDNQLFTTEADVIIDDEAGYVLDKRFSNQPVRLD